MDTQKFKYLYVLLAAVLFFYLSSCSNEPIDNENIYIVKQTKLGTQIRSVIKVLAEFTGVNVTPKYDVNIYKIEYYSKTKNTTTIVASGIICVPITEENKRGIVSLQHYSLIKNYESPSQNTSKSILTTMEAVVTASLGYIATSNDYIGFGSTANSNIPQPYHIYSYSTDDWLMFMQATNEFIENNSISTSKNLWFSGYSQGGYNVTAAMKKWETENHNFFNLQEVYSGSGAYSISGLIDVIFNDNDYQAIQMSPLFITAYNYYYDLGMKYENIYKPSYRNIIDDLYDVNGSASSEYISDTMIPKKLDLFFEETFIDEIKNKNGMFYYKLQENNLTNFTPHSKLYMFHSNNDEYIPVAIAETAYNYYVSVGGNVELIKSPSEKKHVETFVDFMNFVLNRLK